MPDEKPTPDPELPDRTPDPPAAMQWMMQQAAAGQSATTPPVGERTALSLGPAPSEHVLAARQQRVGDALRGNERLTAGLDEAAAETLLEWGLEVGRLIVQDTAELDDAAAEDVLQPRVRAARRLMMATAKATTATTEPAEWPEQAAVALGDRFRPPDAAQTRALGEQWRALAGQPQEQIAALRRLIEDHTDRQP